MIDHRATKSSGKWLGLILCVFLFNPGAYAGVSSQLPNDSQLIRQENLGEVLHAKKLDRMFASLKTATNEKDARQIESAIWQLWFNPDNLEIKRMMSTIMTTRQAGNYDAAIQLLNELIDSYPDYSEGWNQRATIYFLMGDFDKSVLDVAQTLKREPRHFGAYAGLAIILWQQGKQDLARKSLREAIRIHPFLREQDMFDR
ncbi:MAG: tetratricopeptide (TPR) repeat protein [Gammaproteobacteria bacterium]|jgi:tetratricopeptide (TPR) repeat protein